MVFENIYYSTILAKWYGILAMTQINEKREGQGMKNSEKNGSPLYFRSSFIQLLLS